MKIKGHTRIELTNVNTGKKDVIEHSNTITDGVVKHLISSGAMLNSPFENYTWARQHMWRNLFGGILLFDTPISADENDNYPSIMPGGTKMIGNGSYGVSNSTTVTEHGSWNSTESSATADTITMVYDWTTSQGNGTISSICLTSDIGGSIGYGNSVSNMGNTTIRKDFLLNQTNGYNTLLATLTGTSNSKYTINNNVLYWIGSNNTAYVQGTTFTLNIRPFPIDDVSIFTATQTRTVTIPSAISTSNKYVFALKNGKFAFVPQTNLANNASATIAIYDCASDTWTSKTITNTTGISIPVYYGFFTETKFYYFGASNTNLYTYDFTNSTWKTIANAKYGTTAHYLIEISDNLVVVRDNSSGWHKMVDLVNETAYYINAVSGNTSLDNTFVVGNNRWQNGEKGWFRNPLYLATVNNLDSPVTKTAEQTMKVTYTLAKA